MLHVAGDPSYVGVTDAVAVVGARRATPYGLTVARELGSGLSAAGVHVVSGLALGVDSAAHAGALEGTASPVAVLAGGADRPYPASKRQLHAAVRSLGAVVSEMPPGFGIHRWAFVARNRLIAALAQVVVVVEATRRSGSLTTADLGAELGRTVAAVPGRVTCAVATGTNGLIRDGALLVRGVRDVLDALSELTGERYETSAPGSHARARAAAAARRDRRRPLDAADAGRPRARAAGGAHRARGARGARPDPARLRRAL